MSDNFTELVILLLGQHKYDESLPVSILRPVGRSQGWTWAAVPYPGPYSPGLPPGLHGLDGAACQLRQEALAVVGMQRLPGLEAPGAVQGTKVHMVGTGTLTDTYRLPRSAEPHKQATCRVVQSRSTRRPASAAAALAVELELELEVEVAASARIWRPLARWRGRSAPRQGGGGRWT